jgi:hypothetical protein
MSMTRVGTKMGHTTMSPAVLHCFSRRYLQVGDTDHEMACRCLGGAITLCHDIVVRIWCGIARCARASSIGPVLQQLQGVLTDVMVIQAAETFASASAMQNGAATGARNTEGIRTDCDGIGQATYAFAPLATETFGRLGKPAMQLLTRLAGMAAGSGKLDKGRLRDAPCGS